MNIYDVIEMLKLGEGWMVEFKEVLPKPASLASTLVAFANHQGGTILVGVNDKGKVVGFKPTKDDRDNILRAGRDGCKPGMPNLEVSEFTLEGKPLVAIRVPESPSEVYSTSDGKYLIREGSENVAIEWRKLDELIRERKGIFFEQSPCEGAAFDDIDSGKVRRYIRARAEKFKTQIDIPAEEILKSRHCVIEQSGRLTPTHAGILLFGKEPQKFLPMTYVTVVQFKGTEHGGGYVDRKDFTGSLTELVDKTTEWVDARMYHGGQVPRRSVIREELLQFDLLSLREVLVNAVAHRDYTNVGSRIIVNMFEDRLEVQSPGKLPGHITIKNILHAQYARNPSILMVLMEWGYSEGIGEGMNRVFKDLKQRHYRKPKLLDTGASFIFTMMAKDVEKALKKNEPAIVHGLNKRQERALAYLKKHGMMTVSDHLKINPKITSRTAHNDLIGLVKQKIVRSLGTKKGRRYALSEMRNFR